MCRLPSLYVDVILLDRAFVESYRPVSLCTCVGKIVKKVVCAHLKFFLTFNKLLHSFQHGFVSSKSTLTNLLSTDCHIANIMISGHPYDIALFDFKKPIDKAPHFWIVEAALEMGVEDRTLVWLSSFWLAALREYVLMAYILSLLKISEPAKNFP